MGNTALSPGWLSAFHGPQASRARGFTLMEVLIVMTVISILALFAIPFYQNYLTRTQVITELTYLKAMRNRIDEYYVFNGTFPTSNTEAGFDSPTSYAHGKVAKIYVDSEPVEGSLITEFNQPKFHSDNLLIYTPSIVNGQVVWSCKQSTIPPLFLPDQCK